MVSKSFLALKISLLMEAIAGDIVEEYGVGMGLRV